MIKVGMKEPKNKQKVFVVMYTKEGLKFEMILGPLKFEPIRSRSSRSK